MMKIGKFALVLMIASPADAQTFNGYPCTQDCSGHQAGYEWAQNNGITDESQCGGNSNSFEEGCQSYVQEQQSEASEDSSTGEDVDSE